MADLDQLRKLLLEKERSRLEAIEDQLGDRERRTAELSEILPDSIDRLKQDQRLQNSLDQPLTRGIQTIISRNPKAFAGMFYPVLGPAIRRAVAEALKGLLENINRTMEYGFSIRSWRWRIESWRTGVPFNQIVLKHTLAYSVDEVFLIQRHSGHLIARVAREPTAVLDKDAMAALLTAIQHFIQESFDYDDDHPVRSIEVSEQTLWIIPGVEAVLVAVIQGTVGREARQLLQEQLELLHLQHEQALQDIDLSRSRQQEIEHTLRNCLLRKELAEASKNSLKTMLIRLAVLVVILLGVVGWLAWRWWSLDSIRDQLTAGLDQQPGWIVLDDSLGRNQVQIRALRDPYAISTAELLAQHNIDSRYVNFEVQAYQSLDPALTLQRLSDAIGVEQQYLQLQAPDSLDPGLTESTLLTVSRPVKRSAWLDLISLSRTFGIQIDNAPNLDIGYLMRILAVPDEVQLYWRGDVLVVEGKVDPDWRDRLPGRLVEFGIDAIVDDLSASTYEHRVSLFRQRWGDYLLGFSSDDSLTWEGETSLRSFINEASLIRLESPSGRIPYKVILSGLTDGEFDAQVNISLRMARAQFIRQQLLESGFAQDGVEIEPVITHLEENNIRAVRITLESTDSGSDES